MSNSLSLVCLTNTNSESHQFCFLKKVILILSQLSFLHQLLRDAALGEWNVKAGIYSLNFLSDHILQVNKNC